MIVIDLENTISNSGHRMHFLYNCDNKRFQEEFSNDSVNNDVKFFIDSLAHKGHEIIILTAKTANYRQIVIDWLIKNEVFFDALLMKPEDSKESDISFKEKFVKRNATKILFALNDVGKECAMFAKNNVPCLRIQQL